MDGSTTFQPTPDPTPDPTPEPAPAALRAPRWLRVTAISAAVAAVLALAGVAAVARGGPGEHRAERVAMAVAHGADAGRLGMSAGSDAARGRLEGVRGRMAERRQERRADGMAARHGALAESLGVDPADVAAAMEAGRTAGREAALATAAEALGIDVADLEAALAELRPRDGGSL